MQSLEDFRKSFSTIGPLPSMTSLATGAGGTTGTVAPPAADCDENGVIKAALERMWLADVKASAAGGGNDESGREKVPPHNPEESPPRPKQTSAPEEGDEEDLVLILGESDTPCSLLLDPASNHNLQIDNFLLSSPEQTRDKHATNRQQDDSCCTTAVEVTGKN
jgi:hypothetical protein